MAIEGLNELVTNFDSTSDTYNDDFEKILEELNNYVENKSVEKFLDDYIEREPMFNEDTSNMSLEDKEYTASKLARSRHDVEIENNETIKEEDENGNVISEKDANEVEKFQNELSKVREQAEKNKQRFMKNKVGAAREAQEYQARKIEEVEKELGEIKKELEDRERKDKELADEIKLIENGNSEFDTKIADVQKEKEELEKQIEEKTKLMEQIKKNDPDEFEQNEYYNAYAKEIEGLHSQVEGKERAIAGIEKDKATRKSELINEKSDLKIEEYTNNFNTLSDKLREQKEKYKENAIKLEENFKKMGIDLNKEFSTKEVSDTEVTKAEQKDSNSKEKSSGGAVNNGAVGTQQVDNKENALVKAPVGRQAALNKISEYYEKSDPNERLDRLSNSDDYENLTSAINDIGITDYLQRKELKNAFDENTKILNDNMKESEYYVQMLEGMLGRKLSKSQIDMCKNMFNKDQDKKGKTNNILSGTGKFSKSDLEQMKDVINEVKNADLEPEQQKEFEDNFMKYVQMGSLNSQINKNFVSRLWHNKVPTKGARAERQLENAISSYTNDKIEKNQENPSKGFFDMLESGKEPASKYASLDPEYSSSRTKKVETKSR